jgi:RNA polymerase sigma-70 factor (ECF subfamily)
MATARGLVLGSGAEALSSEDLRRVRAVLFLNGLRGADLEDAAQEVQLRLLERPPTDVGARSAWAAVVATRLAMDQHRRETSKRRALGRLRLITDEQDRSPDPALAVAVRQALEALEPELRATVVLRFFVDLPVAEIARLTDAPEGTVKSRLHRAAAVLRAHLGTEEVS